MATSKAINAKSFCNYVVNVCTYFDDTSLSSDNKTQLYNYLIDGVSASALLNIKTALAILNRIYYLMTGSNKTITVTNGSQSSALSYNSAKSLVSLVLTSTYKKKFCRLNQVYDNTGNFNSYNYSTQTFYLPATSSFGSPTLEGTLYGGGGGGGGAYAGDGDKNASYTVTSGSGAAGTASTITLNGTTKNTANGGSGGASKTSGKVGGNPTVHASGNAGSDGSTSSVNFAVTRKVALVITPGSGGGGGGGCAAAAGGTTGTKTFTASSGSGTSGGTGKSGANEWSGNDDTFGGGGGGGGASGSGANSAYQGPWKSGQVDTTQSGLNASGGKGGLGGCTNKGNAGAQPNTIGTGGKAGPVYFTTDVSAVANGGNGGNSGGFVLTTSCSAATCLFIWR